MRIYMIRHGETALNAAGCYYGCTDVGLTDKGRRQAEGLGRFFCGKTWDHIVVSPLRRALDTAVLASGYRVSDFDLDPRLKEQNFGIFEGKTYQELEQKYPRELEAWNTNFSDYRIPGGESFADVRARVDKWIKDIPSGEGNMLLVAHKGTLGHMTASLLGMPLEGYWNFVFDQGCYSCIDLEDGYAIVRKLNQSVDR